MLYGCTLRIRITNSPVYCCHVYTNIIPAKHRKSVCDCFIRNETKYMVKLAMIITV